jgi:S-disulfanyl-L-cysteine oxidoreductase SoxD
MSKGTLALVAMLAAMSAHAADQTLHGIGRPLTPDDFRAVSPIVFPDGAGLHGAKGEGSDDFPALAGGVGTLKSKEPVVTVGSYWPHATTLWDYIHRAMPYAEPGSLSVDDTYALTAYVLRLNGIVGEAAVLDDRSLPRIRMPNRAGFVADPRPDFPARAHSR